MKKLRRKTKLHKTRHVKRAAKKHDLVGKIDRGTIFIVAILTCLIFLGYIMVGGTIPEKIPAPRTEGIMSVDLKQKYPQEPGLQLHTFQGATITPYPTQVPPVPQPNTDPLNDVDCADSIPGILPDLIWGYRVTSTPASNNQQALQVFYSGLDAITLGTTEQTQRPTQHLSNPPTTTTNKDVHGYPVSASVFVTDITANPGDRSGDAGNGGVPNFPTEIFGAWKTETGRSSTVPNGQTLGTGADLWPPANGPGGGSRNSTWTAELIWPVTGLKTKLGTSMVKGNTYRFQIIVHSGGSNEQVGEACATFKY